MKLDISLFLEFDESENLELQINERPYDFRRRIHLERFYCSFKHAEIEDGDLLKGASGNGETIEKSIIDYMQQISGKTLVIDAYKDTRRRIVVPKWDFQVEA